MAHCNPKTIFPQLTFPSLPRLHLSVDSPAKKSPLARARDHFPSDSRSCYVSTESMSNILDLDQQESIDYS